MSSKDYIIVKDGEMVHFKYIKRERVNGEWRYYYDKGSIGRSIKKAVGIDARNAYRSARDAAVTAENERSEAHENMVRESAQARTTKAEAEAVRKETPAVSDQQLQRLQNFYVTATENVVAAKKELAAAQKAGSNLPPTSTGKLTSNVTAVQKDSASSPAVKAAQEKLAKAEQLAVQAKSDYNNAFKASQNANKANAYEKVADKQAKEAAEASRKNSAAAQKSSDAQMAAQEALKKYYKTPLGSLKFLSDKGKELLYKIF